MSQDLDTKQLMKRFDPSLTVEPPVWKAPVEAGRRVPTLNDSLLSGWLNGRWPLLVTLGMSYLLTNSWSFQNSNWLAGVVLIPLVVLLVWPLMPDAPSRHPSRLMLPCLLALLAFTGLLSAAQWKLGLKGSYDPLFLFGELQRHLERLTDPWRLALIGLALVSAVGVARRVAHSHPWLDRGSKRLVGLRLLAALPLTLLLIYALAPAAILAWNLDNSWADDVRKDPDYEYISSGRLPASQVYLEMARALQTPEDPARLLELVKTAPSGRVEQMAAFLAPLFEGPDEGLALSAVPLADQVLRRADESRVSTLATVDLLMAYERFIYHPGRHWTHSEHIQEQNILFPVLAEAPLTVPQMEALMAGIPRPGPSDRKELRRFMDLTAVSLLSETWHGEAGPYYRERALDAPGPLTLFGRQVSPLSLPEMWLQAEGQVLLQGYRQWREGDSRSLDNLKEALALETRVPLLDNAGTQVRARTLESSLQRTRGVMGYALAAQILSARLVKEKTGRYPEKLFGDVSWSEGRYLPGGRYKEPMGQSYRSHGKTATVRYNKQEWTLP